MEKIRLMTVKDLDMIMEIELEAFSMPWSYESYVNDILLEQKSILESIKQINSEVVRKALEVDYERLEQDLKKARKA